jgi:SAM-dependent methyltransferase
MKPVKTIPNVRIPGAARSGEAVARELYPHFRSARATAPSGELAAFAGLVVANQYRLAYGITLGLLSPGSQVLDWGCGDGHFSYFLLTAGHSVSSFSLQHEPHLLANLPDFLRGRYRYVQGNSSDPTRLPFPDSFFDAAFSVGVLEHVREEGGTEIASLRELRRVLKPSGLLICCHLPNRHSWIEGITTAVHAIRRAGKTRHHEFRFRRRDIRQLCGAAGFELLMMRRYGMLPRNVLRHLPAALRDSDAVTAALNRCDDALALAFGIVSQNHLFVARPL